MSLAGGSADPNLNALLANVLKWAKDSDVPKENIEKAIARVSPLAHIRLNCRTLSGDRAFNKCY